MLRLLSLRIFMNSTQPDCQPGSSETRYDSLYLESGLYMFFLNFSFLPMIV